LLAFGGGIVGVFLAWWGSRLLLLMASAGPRPLPLDVTPNARILGFTLFASLLSAVIFGITPALRATRLDLHSAIKEGKGAVQATSQSRLGKVLVVAQVALSLLLMVGAGLFMRTLINLQNIPSGFNQQNVMLFQIDSSATGYQDEQFAPLFQEVEAKVKAVPGVQAASFSFFIFNQGGWTSLVSTPDETPTDGRSRVVRQNAVGPDYFAAMGIPLVSGRGFTPQDTDKSQKVAVVSETMAQRFFGNTSPLGRRFWVGRDSRDQIEIIGVVKDAKYESLTETSRPMAYYPHAQHSQPLSNFVVRFSGPPATYVPQVRRAIREVNRNLPIDEVVSLSEHVDRSLVQQKLLARFASFFGLLALLLACVGLYGILSYSVARRTGEIGIRMALGAGTADVLKLVLKGGMTLTLIGVALGMAGAFALTRLTSALLFGVKPTDVVTFGAVAATMIIVAFVACYIPARRATKVDPLVALRYE
jgi:predicted permease